MKSDELKAAADDLWYRNWLKWIRSKRGSACICSWQYCAGIKIIKDSFFRGVVLRLGGGVRGDQQGWLILWASPVTLREHSSRDLTQWGVCFTKKSTLDSYSYQNKSWINFLESGPAGAIPHSDGVILQDLLGGRFLAALLVAYLGYMNELDDKGKRRYSVTTQRGRVSSVIAYQRLAFHEIGRLPLVWSAITKLERLHIPKEKCWLNVTQFRILGLAVWSVRHSSSLEMVYRMVYTLMSETIYRIGNILPQNPTSKLELCDFKWEDFEFKRDGRRNILDITLDEKRDRRGVKTPKVAKGSIHKRLRSGSVYEATYLAKKEVSSLSGYLAVGGGDHHATNVPEVAEGIGCGGRNRVVS